MQKCTQCNMESENFVGTQQGWLCESCFLKSHPTLRDVMKKLDSIEERLKHIEQQI